ncbi:MAG: SPASM domain-containing protein [Clostridia bacterium]|nr:SPASM domain-containing protein [Clostridia bacterium]
MSSKRPFDFVEIEVNSKCNRSCSYCPNATLTRKETGEMEESLFKLLMEQLKSINYDGIVNYHFFGEPLLCSNLDKFVSMTKKYLPHSTPQIFSNGDFLDKKRIKDLVELGIEKFVVTQHIGPKNDFESVLNTLSEDLRSKIIYRTYKDMNLSNRSGILSEKVTGSASSSNKIPCTIPVGFVIITLLGNVLPCYDDFHQKNTMGNIKDDNIVDIWNSEKYIKFRKMLSEGHRDYSPACKDCTSYAASNNPFDNIEDGLERELVMV